MPAGELADVFAGVEDQVPDALADHLRNIAAGRPPRARHVQQAVDRAGFEASINEGSTDPVPDFMTEFDSPLGLVDPALVRTAFWGCPHMPAPTNTGPAAARSAPTS